MPRRLMRDGYRGWYGWEGRFNSLIRMSADSMNNTHAKNKQERFQLRLSQEQLEEEERKFMEKNHKELYSIRNELWSIRQVCGPTCSSYYGAIA